MSETRVGKADELGPGSVAGAGKYAVCNIAGERTAVTRKCRHLRADLAEGSVDEEGRLVCPWHQAAYDSSTGRMVRGPQGSFAKVPGLGAFFRGLTKVAPLGRGRVSERDGDVYVE